MYDGYNFEVYCDRELCSKVITKDNNNVTMAISQKGGHIEFMNYNREVVEEKLSEEVRLDIIYYPYPNFYFYFYYNFECNCAGKLLLHGGEAGTERPGASEEVLKSVKRWASLGTEPFEERVGECTWEVALVIPASAIFRHEIETFNGKTMRANFYKCGDRCSRPHFLSWSPIDCEEPNFHKPEFFGRVDLV